MMGWAVYIGDFRYTWYLNEWLAEELVNDLREAMDDDSDIYYKWEKR